MQRLSKFLILGDDQTWLIYLNAYISSVTSASCQLQRVRRNADRCTTWRLWYEAQIEGDFKLFRVTRWETPSLHILQNDGCVSFCPDINKRICVWALLAICTRIYWKYNLPFCRCTLFLIYKKRNAPVFSSMDQIKTQSTGWQTELLTSCFNPGLSLGLSFDSGDGRDMFLRNVGWLLTDYTSVYRGRYYCWSLFAHNVE
jgi:hypothetical protein